MIVCSECGIRFEPKAAHQKYCGNACRAAAHRYRAGDMVASVQLSYKMLAGLIERGFLTEAESRDRDRVSAVLSAVIADYLNVPGNNIVTRYGRESRPAVVIDQVKPENDR